MLQKRRASTLKRDGESGEKWTMTLKLLPGGFSGEVWAKRRSAGAKDRGQISGGGVQTLTAGSWGVRLSAQAASGRTETQMGNNHCSLSLDSSAAENSPRRFGLC